jgi:TPR repeat protein
VAPQSVARLDPAVVALLVARGNEMLARGDISAARLLYARAASAGNAAAATAMGRSFDAAVLEGLGVRGIRPDPEQAAHWYGRARELGTARP